MSTNWLQTVIQSIFSPESAVCVMFDGVAYKSRIFLIDINIGRGGGSNSPKNSTPSGAEDVAELSIYFIIESQSKCSLKRSNICFQF